VTDLVHQDGERLAVAAAGPLDEVSIHLVASGVVATGMAAITHYDGRHEPERSGRDDRTPSLEEHHVAPGARRISTDPLLDPDPPKPGLFVEGEARRVVGLDARD